MATVIITGGTGLIGSALSKALAAQGHKVIILTRKAKGAKPSGSIQYAEWDPERGHIDRDAVSQADCIVHLAGANVAEGRWTDKRRKEIIDSRVKSGELIVKALKEIPNRIKAVISSSATGYYGPDPQKPNPKPFVEEDQPANDFLGTVVQKWEAAVEPVASLGKRLVILRTGIVLSKEGGAYAEFRKPLNFRLATILGPGSQTVSWIHIDDLVRLYIETMENETWSGIYNAVAPKPVTNKELILSMARTKKFYLPVPVPSFALKLVLGEMSVEVLKSTTVSSGRVVREGFHFLYSDINDAIKQLEAS